MGVNFVMVGPPGGRRARGKEKPGEKPSFRERVHALRYVPRLVRLVWQTHRGLAVTMGALRLIRAFVPIATLWIGKLIIDGVVAAQRSGSSWRTISGLIAIEIAIVIVGELLARASS